jgi:hypothetical protein
LTDIAARLPCRASDGAIERNRPKGIIMTSDIALDGDEENTVLELLDRLLNTGVVVCGDLVVSVADIELLYLRLQLTLSSVETAQRAGWCVPTVNSCNQQLEKQHV